jgi:predicted acetyltransferase
MTTTRLVRPAREHLAAYAEALRRGWSPNTTRPEAAQEELAQIAADADTFLALMDDPEARGGPVTLPDGSQVARLPGLRRWLWDGDGSGAFAGSINLRWQAGTAELPPHVLGHIGYSVVPWMRRQGHATRGLALMLAEARRVGLPWVELTTDPDNVPSQRVIEANRGWLVERFSKGAAYGGAPGLRYRIDLR